MPTMKLQAVTICINYADYLECIAANRRHFDRWVVVTVPGDAATAAVCARHGLEVVLSETLRADGQDFNAVDNKARAVNEGLARLDGEGWVLVLDADVLLPRDFRARLAALPLEAGCLYGAAGRRVCEERETFTVLRGLEPWERLAARNSQVLGYFNLFHAGTRPNRYVPAGGGDSVVHDDARFMTSFAPPARRQVPMTVIHVGPMYQNWARRVSLGFEVVETVAGFDAVVARVAREAGGGTVGMVDYFPGGRWRAVAGGFREALLVDHGAVHAPSGDPLVEADRGVLRGLWAAEAAGLPGVRRLGPHSAQSLAQIADGSLDALYLPGEVAPSWLVAALPHWLPKLRPGGIVFGDLHGLPHWREATFTINLLLGVPDETDPCGAWWKRLCEKPPLPVPPASRRGGLSDAERDGVVLVNSGKDGLERLLLSAHAVREHWAGPVRIYHWGEEDESLAIACARLGIGLHHVSEEAAPLDDTVTELVAVHPYRRALILRPGMLPVRPLAEIFSAEDKNRTADENGAASGGEAASFPRASEMIEGTQRVPLQRPVSHISPLLAERGVASAVAVAMAQDFSGDEVAVVSFDGETETWSEEAWEVWSLREAALALAMAVEVQVAADATIVTLVDEESAGDFQRASLTWKFPRGTPVLVGLIGLPAEDLWLPGATPETRLAPLSREQADDLPWLLRWLAAECQTARVIFLPCQATALPGAELWAGEAWATTVNALDGTPAAREGETVTGNRFIPRPFCGMIGRARLPEIAATWAAGGASWRELPLVMEDVRRLEVAAFPWVDLSTKGWRRPAKGGWIIPDGTPGQEDFEKRRIVPLRTKKMPDDVPIRGFYHVLLVNHWREIVAEQVNEMVASGLYDAATEFEVGALGPAAEVEALRDVLAATPKLRVVFHDENPNLYEHATLGRLIAAARQGEFYAVYAHTKGVTHRGDSHAGWRREMNRHIFAHWRANVAQLAAGCDTSGGRLYRANGCWPRHYSGNFWWARAAYIRTLRELHPAHRHDAEMWLLSGRARIHDLGEP